MIHELKIWPEPFELIRLGVKTCEVRQEIGGGQFREFRAGDVLKLREFSPIAGGNRIAAGYTGRWITAHVTEILKLDEAPHGWGIQVKGCGIVVMSLRVLERPPGQAPDHLGRVVGDMEGGV